MLGADVGVPDQAGGVGPAGPRAANAAGSPRAAGRDLRLSPGAAFGVVLAFVLVLAGLAATGTVQRHPTLLWSVLGAGAALLGWNVAVWTAARRAGDRPALTVRFRPQHYVQACAQAAVLLYWGWHWRPVYDAAPLVAAQLVFACGLDLLLAWSRRERATLGFGPVPVVFSINLFLWFRDDWFYFQFLLVALGFAAKALIRRDREGQRVHVFNPAAFPLAVFALALILTGRSDLTWGQEIAITQFYPTHVYAVLFLVALPGQYLFGVASMTMAAVVTTWAFGAAYFALTGVYFFYDSYIPIAVFLGMHLLFTDPSTSPRTELGRLAFGMLYGLSTVALYALLGRFGAPAFYDKLLQVPLLNLSVPLIERVVRSPWLRAIDPAAVGRGLAPRHRHLAWIAVWAALFASLSAAGHLGDRHPGQWLPFWQEACAAGRPPACTYLAARQAALCEAGSGWACNEAGLLLASPALPDGGLLDVPPAEAPAAFEAGCRLGFASACANARAFAAGGAPAERAAPTLSDYPLLVRGSKGVVTDRRPAALYRRACEQGWRDACARADAAEGAVEDP